MSEYNQQGQVLRGAYGLGNVVEDLKKYDKDKAGFLLYKKKGTAKLMSMVAKRFGRRSVTSMEPKWFNIGELDHIFKVAVSQDPNTTADFKRIVMTNEQAIQLQTNDVLAVDGLFLADGYLGSTVGEYSRTWTPANGMEEQMIVEREPIKDSHSPGFAYVYVRRGHIADVRDGRVISEPTPQAAGFLKDTDQLLKIPKVTLALLAEYEREIMEIVESDGEIIIEYIDVFVVESVDGVFKRFRGPYNRDTAIAKAREYAELNMNPAVRYYVARWPYKNGYAAPELITATEKVMN